jgi:hypothetical protein
MDSLPNVPRPFEVLVAQAFLERLHTVRMGRQNQGEHKTKSVYEDFVARRRALLLLAAVDLPRHITLWANIIVWA